MHGIYTFIHGSPEATSMAMHETCILCMKHAWNTHESIKRVIIDIETKHATLKFYHS